jgi:alkylation response protein AidB-like acyl-CoA dehydrogenase
MNLDFSDDQKLLRETAREFLAERSPLSLCRRVLDDDAEPFAADLWSELGRMGWLGTTIPERHGGAGHGHLELALLCEELGRALAPVPFGSSVTLATELLLLAGSEEQRARVLPKLASGERVGTLAVAEGSGPLRPEAMGARLEGGRLTGTKRAVPDGTAAHFCIALAESDRGPTLALVDLEAGDVRREPIPSLDPSRPLSRLHFDDAAAETLGDEGAGWRLFETLRERAAVLQAFEQIGGAERALELTRAFTLERHAFGRPVASYQALKHRMADLYVALELARSHAYYAAWALSTNAPELSEAACSARIAACRAFELASAEMIQMHGGVGFTWEYDCQLFYRRAKALAISLGSTREWTDRLVESLARSSAVGE